MLRRLMAAESMYYESLASARYVEEAKKGTEPDVFKKRKRRTCCIIVYGWAET